MSSRAQSSSEAKQQHSSRESQNTFGEGDHVIYHPVGGAMQTSTGVIKKIFTHTQPVGESGIHAKASEEHPRYLILNDHTHKESAYKRENIVEFVKE